MFYLADHYSFCRHLLAIQCHVLQPCWCLLLFCIARHEIWATQNVSTYIVTAYELCSFYAADWVPDQWITVSLYTAALGGRRTEHIWGFRLLPLICSAQPGFHLYSNFSTICLWFFNIQQLSFPKSRFNFLSFKSRFHFLNFKSRFTFLTFDVLLGTCVACAWVQVFLSYLYWLISPLFTIHTVNNITLT